MSATFALVPLADSVTQLAGIFALGAVCSQGIAIGGHALIARQYGAAAGPGLNGINAAFGAGSLLAPFLHTALAPSMQSRGATASYFALAAMLAAAAVPFAASAFVRDTAPPRTTRADHSGTASPLAALGGRNGAALTCSVMGLVTCAVGAEAVWAVWLYTYASQGLQLPVAAAASCVSGFWAALTFGRLMGVAASTRLPPATILRASLPLAVAGPGVALAIPGSPAALVAGAALAGLGLSCCFANAVALLARHVAPTSSTQALIQLAACSGGLVFAPLVGRLAGNGMLGANAFLYVAGACAVADLALLAVAEAMCARMAHTQKAARAAEQQP